MSRAFVKEDVETIEAPLERPISAAPNKVTPRGLRLIGEEIARLEVALGAEPDQETESQLRRDLRYWSARSATAQLVEPEAEPQAAKFGTRVSIRRGGEVSEVEIVGEDEADPTEGRLAWTSPLARALEDAEAGDVVELAAGGRVEPIEVLAVRSLYAAALPA
jgi:transcription elongation GreA/GreB family factor